MSALLALENFAVQDVFDSPCYEQPIESGESRQTAPSSLSSIRILVLGVLEILVYFVLFQARAVMCS